MFCSIKIVYITRQKSTSQFLGATHTPWLSHDGSRADCTLAQFYSLSHSLFSMQRKARQKKWEGVWHYVTFQDFPSKIPGENLPH